MNLYIFTILLLLWFLQTVELGILLGKIGEERKGKYGFIDLIVSLTLTLLLSFAVIKAIEIYYSI